MELSNIPRRPHLEKRGIRLFLDIPVMSHGNTMSMVRFFVLLLIFKKAMWFSLSGMGNCMSTFFIPKTLFRLHRSMISTIITTRGQKMYWRWCDVIPLVLIGREWLLYSKNYRFFFEKYQCQRKEFFSIDFFLLLHTWYTYIMCVIFFIFFDVFVSWTVFFFHFW